jgi:hypothetical protein
MEGVEALKSLRSLRIDGNMLGRGLHSPTFQLNVSAFGGIGGEIRGCLRGVWEV